MTMAPVERYAPADLSGQTLDQLAETIRREDAAAHAAAETALASAIRAGEALLEAKRHVEPGRWVSWVEGVVPRTTAKTYMRLATYRDDVTASGVTGVAAARNLLVGYPPIAKTGPALFTHLRDEALRLHKDNVPVSAIASSLGVAHTTVSTWVDPEFAQKRAAMRRRDKARGKAARRALREKEKRNARDAAAKAAGGNIAKAYALIRQTAAAIDQAADQCVSKDDARSLRAKLANLYEVEDEICRILRAP